MNFRHKLLIGILLFFALFNAGKWMVNFINAPYEPIDFRGCYLSSLAYWQGNNPYSYKDQTDLWLPIQEENHAWPMIENSVYSTPLYPPQYVVFFGLYNLFNFKTAIFIQGVLNVLALLLIVYAVNILNPSVSKKTIALFIMAFRGTWYALDTGQPMLQVFALSLLVLCFLQKKPNRLLPGLILGFIAFKFTLLIPMLFYLLYTKQYKTFLSMVLFSAFLNGFVLLYDTDALTHIQSWFACMHLMNDYLHTAETYNGLAIIATSITIPFSAFFHFESSLSSGPLMVVLRILIPLIPYVFIWMLRKKMNWQFLMFLTALCGLCFGHHLIYDVLTVLSLRLIAYEKDQKINVLEYILLALLILPLGKIVDVSHWQVLHFFPAIFLFIYFLTLLFNLFIDKKHQNKESQLNEINR